MKDFKIIMPYEEVAWRIGNLLIPLDEENCDICAYQEAKKIAIDFFLKRAKESEE